jgi:hypothetical protein
VLVVKTGLVANPWLNFNLVFYFCISECLFISKLQRKKLLITDSIFEEISIKRLLGSLFGILG